jgi:hypothetical protein
VVLNPAEAALMDQGVHGADHQSKQSRLQVRAQLANAGFRDDEDLAGRPVVELAGRTPTGEQRRRGLARNNYPVVEAGPV